MASILGFLRRKGPSDADAARSRAAPLPTPPLAPPPAAASSSRAEKDESAVEYIADLAPTRRQASQLNLNRYFASAPAGLSAVLKQPSRPDLEATKSGGSSGTLQAPAPQPTSQQAQAQHMPAQGSADAPQAPMRPMRERRRSMTVSEVAQSMQNIDVSQAAMIMMPNRMRKELGQSSFTQTQQQQAAMQLQMLQQAMAGGGPPVLLSPSQLPHLSRTNGQLPSLPSSDSTPTGPAAPAGALGSGAALTGPRLERKPSIIREAVKLTQGAVVGGGGGVESQLRNHAGNFNGELQQAPLSQIASALAGQGLERNSGNIIRPAGDRRTSTMVTSQQLGLGAGGTGSNRALLNVGGSGGLSPTGAFGAGQPQPPSTPSGAPRRSDQGEPSFRGRPAGGLGLRGSAALEESPTGGYGASREPLRRGIMANRSADHHPSLSPHQQQQQPQADDEAQLLPTSGGDVKLPSIATGGVRRANGDTRDKDGTGRGGLSAADVAALSEAINSYQNEATRLRAAALRKMDTRIKRAVMDRHMNGGGEDDTSPAGLVDNGNPLAPLLRSPVAAATSRNSLLQASSPARSRLPDSSVRGARRG